MYINIYLQNISFDGIPIKYTIKPILLSIKVLQGIFKIIDSNIQEPSCLILDAKTYDGNNEL